MTSLNAQIWGWIEDMNWETNVKAIDFRTDNFNKVAIFDVSTNPLYTFYTVKNADIEGDILSLEFILDSELNEQNIDKSAVKVMKWTVDLKDLFTAEADAGNGFNQLIFNEDAVEMKSAILSGIFMSPVEGSEQIEYGNVMNIQFYEDKEQEMLMLFKHLAKL